MSATEIRANGPYPGTDAKVGFNGTFVFVTPVTAEAKEWIDDNVIGESTWYAGSLIVEPRYATSLLGGMGDAGLILKREDS